MGAAQAQGSGRAAPLVFVVKGTPAWGAWIARGHKPGLDYATAPDGRKRGGWYFPTLWPPGAEPPDEGAGGA